MLTTFLISISFATNVVQTPIAFERHDMIPCPDGMSGCLVIHWKGVNPTAVKWTTNVFKVYTASGEVDGEKVTVETHRKLVSETSAVLQKEVVTQWKPAK